MRIALVHDRLSGPWGSERAFQHICEAFPEADVYTLTYNRSATLPYFASRNVRTTWLDPLVRSTLGFKLAFPIATHVMESLRLSDYDLVLSSSATVAKYVTVTGGAHVCYCYIPTRAIWHSEEYFDDGDLRAKVFSRIIRHLRKRDYAAAQRVDHFLTISEVSRDFIRRYYDRESEVVPCPIDLARFYTSSKGNNYLLVSRLEHWKRVDYAIEAFNELGLPLRIIGTGEEEKRLRAMAKPNVQFLGAVPDEVVAREYSEALAVIFTPCLEYGLIPLEANASGTPVICYGKGGVCETMVPVGEKNGSPATAVFFEEQTAASLIGGVRRFQNCHFESADLIRHASKWSIPAFHDRVRRSALAALNTTQ